VPHILPSSSLLPFFCLPSFDLGWGCIMRLPDIPHRVGEKGGAHADNAGRPGAIYFTLWHFACLHLGWGCCSWERRGTTREGWVPRRALWSMVMVPSSSYI